MGFVLKVVKGLARLGLIIVKELELKDAYF